MPTYEYACPTCGIVEAFQSIKDDALKKCPKCAKQKVTRLVSLGGGVIFKGSGFWETDYNRSSDYTSRSKSDTSEGTPQTASVPAPATTPTATPTASPAGPATPKASAPVVHPTK